MLAVRGATQSSAIFSIKRNIITVPTNNLLTWLTAWLIWFRWIVMVTAACLPLRQDKKNSISIDGVSSLRVGQRVAIKGNCLFRISHFILRPHNWASLDVFTPRISCLQTLWRTVTFFFIYQHFSRAAGILYCSLHTTPDTCSRKKPSATKCRMLPSPPVFAPTCEFQLQARI